MEHQTEFLIKFEKLCGVKKPIFIDSSDTFAVTDESLKWSKDLRGLSIGRYRLTNKNSDVCELWIDVDNHDGIPFKQYKQERLIPSIQKLNNLGISNDYIFPKVSGTGIHLHVFISDLPANVDINDLFAKATPESADQRSLVEKHKIREYGADTSTKKGFCGYMSIGELLKARQLPIFKEAVYPQIKLFKCSPEFLLSLSLIKADREQQKIEKDVIVDYERDGDFMQLFKCSLVANLGKKSEHEHHLYHNERLFLMCQFIHFGEESRKKLHEIISHCADYDEKLTQDFIDHAMNANYHPITCKWAKDMRLGCPPDCKGSGGKSPIKFAWTSLSLDELKKEYRKILMLDLEDDEVIDVILADIFDPHIQGDLAWLFLIAPPSWGKTVLLTSIYDSKWAELIDLITDKTFISGKTYFDKKKGEDMPIEGLLPKLKNKTLICKEFTTQIMQGEDMRKAIFGQLRAIYDGRYSQAFGSIDYAKIPEEWKNVRMGFIAGCTPYIDRYGTLNVILGERYLKIRMREPNRLAVVKYARMAAQDKDEKVKNLNKKAKRFIATIDIPEKFEYPPENIGNAMDHLTETIVQCRAPVERHQMALGEIEYEYEESKELGTRLVQQLQRLGWMLTLVRRTKFDINTYKTLVRVSFDTLHPNRKELILHLYKQKEPKTKTDLMKELSWGNRRISRTLTELVIISVVQETEIGNYVLSDYIRKCIRIALSPLSQHSAENLGDGVLQQSLSSNNILNYSTLPISSVHYGKYHNYRKSCDMPWEKDVLPWLRTARRRAPNGVNPCLSCGNELCRIAVSHESKLLQCGKYRRWWRHASK